MKTVHLCGAVAAGFGFLALFGWALGLPFLASLGSDKIPMAPSTALLFVLYGIAALLRAHLPLGRGAHGVGVAVASAGALVALLLLVLSFLGIRPVAELLGFAVVGTVGEAPVGHMSPVTAMCFLLASVSFLGSLPSFSNRLWAAEAAWWTACVLLATSSVLLLAYLFGSPLFYAGSFIPPAATTSIAFAALGTALLALAGRQARPAARTAARPGGAPRSLVLVFVLLAAGIVTVGGLYFRSDARRYRAEVERQLSAVAELKASELTQWRAERLGDASLFLGNTPFSALVRRLFDNPQDAEAQAQLRTWLTKAQSHSAYDRGFLLDARGGERLAVPEGRAPVSSTIARRVPEVLRSGEVAFQDFYRNELDERVYLSVLVPILDERSRALGIVALRDDAEIYLYPLINRWPTPAQSAETLLIRRDGNDALFLNELRFQEHTALGLRIPLAKADVVAVKAVLGHEGIVEARDHRGVPVIAALRAVAGSPWFLVAQMDAAEANAPLRERLWVMVVLVGAMLAAAAAGAGILWREQRFRDFKERYEAERERALLIDGVTDYAILMLHADGHVATWNAGAERLKGYRADEIIGQHFSRFYPEEDVARGKPANELETAAREGRLEDEGWRVRKDGSRFWANVIITALRDENGRLRAFAKVTRDLTEQRRAETRIGHLNRVYAVLSGVNQAIVRIREPQAVFAEVCRIAVETGGFRAAWVGLLDAKANGVRPVAHAGVTDDYLDRLQIGLGDGPHRLGPTASALREGQHHVCNDIEHDPRVVAGREDALARGCRASAAFPLTVNGETLGTLSLYASEPGFFDTEELLLLDEMAMDLSFAMEMARLEDVRLRLATAIEQSPVSVVMTDADGRIEYVNPAFARITGYAPEEALGGNPRMLKSGKQEPALYQELWATISAGKSWHGELVNKRKDGSLYTQEMTIAPIRDAVGKVVHFVAISQDVTERKQAEETLRESEERYRLLFEGMLNGFAYCKMLFDQGRPQDFVYLDVNRAFESLTGLRDVVGKKVSQVIPGIEETDPELFEIYGRVARTGTPETFEAYVAALKMWFSISVYSPKPEHFVAVFDVITERKQAEAALRASEERYRTLFDQNLAGVYRTTVDGRVLECNDAFARIFGYASREEALCGGANALYQTPAAREAFLQSLEAQGVVVNHEFEGRRKDGAAVWLLENAHLVAGEEPGARGMIEGTLVDITERRQIEAQLRQSQKIEAIGQLAGGVAHDFNNILGVITGYGELAQRQLGPEHPVRARVDQMVKAAARAAGLTRQLLAFSRKQVMQPRLLDLDAIVADAEKMLGRLIGEDVQLCIHAAPDLGTVNADPGQVEQVILNLAVNARDAMPKGGSLTIETANVDLDEDYCAAHPPATPGCYVMLAISDTGIGMDQETQQRIFEPFFTTKPKGQGTGLGLATVYGIVKQSGGYIWVYSEPGHGTTFKVHLPRVDEPTKAAVAAVPTAEAPCGHETILLVEDTETLREVIRETLEERGYTVLVASNGEEALALAREREGPIHLLLTDVVMPRLGGGELAKSLSALRPAIRVLYMSGYTDTTISHHGVLGEGVMLLEKPFTGDKLARAVREALDRPTAK